MSFEADGEPNENTYRFAAADFFSRWFLEEIGNTGDLDAVHTKCRTV